MSRSIGPPQQQRQPSRKGKKAWRKNVDIAEVQTGLENLREEIISGGPIAEKESHELFALDTSGSQAIKQRYDLQKPLKIDQILAQRSAVPAVDGRKRILSRIGDGIIEPANKRQKKDWVSKREIQELKQRLDNRIQLSTQQLERNESSGYDLWAQPEEVVSIIESEEYVPKPKPKVAPRTLQQPPISLVASGQHIEAVPNPHAGTSYNPTFDDWDSLLTKVGNSEVEAEVLRRQQEELEREKEARIAASAAEDAGTRTDDESAWEGFESEVDDQSVLKQKRPQRKTPAQRNKIKRRQELEKKARHEQRLADKKKQAAEIAILAKRRLLSATDGTLVQGEDNVEETDVIDHVLRRRRLGNSSVPDKQLEVVLPDELQESLRRLKPEGNLMNDRFRHLLVNGKVENRKPVLQPRKKRQTVTEKWSYKDFSIEV